MRLRLTRDQASSIEFAMIKAFPNECCGLLLGDEKGVVSEVFEGRNIDMSPTTFTLHEDDHFRACEIMAKQGLRLVGVYHSHPEGPAHPSDVDLRNASYIGDGKNHPGVLYVIVSVVDNWLPEIHAYRIDVQENGLYERTYKEVEVVIE